MRIADNNRNNRADAINKNIIQMQIFKSDIRILQMQLRRLQIINCIHMHTPTKYKYISYFTFILLGWWDAHLSSIIINF